MDLQQFLSQSSDSFSGAFNSRFCNQDLSDEVRELAHRGLKLFPVGLSARLAGDPDRLILEATNDILLLEKLSVATQPLWGHRLAIGQSGLCVWRLDGVVGRSSFVALAPDLDESLTTLQACRGDAVYALFQRPAGMKGIVAGRKLPPGLSILDDGAGFDLPARGAAWLNPGADIEVLPYVLRELLEAEDPDSPPGRAMPAPKPSSRPDPCRSTVYSPRADKAAPRKGHPVCGRGDWRGGYRISRRR